MPRPVVSETAEHLYQILSPMAFDDENLDWPLLNYCESIAGALQEVVDYGSDWSQVVDIDRVPYEAIPWLGQLVGVVTPPIVTGETEAEHEDRIREYVRGTPGFSRGTPDAIILAAQQYMTGTKSVILRERNGGAYRLGVLTWQTETHPADRASTNLLINGSFETNTTGWNPSGSTITRDTSIGQHGSASLKTECPGAVNEGAYFYPITGITPGKVYSASVSVFLPVGKTIYLIMDWRTAGDVPVLPAAATIPISGTGGWQRISVTGTAPATTAKCLIGIYTNVPQFVTFWIDAVQFEEQSTATPYIHTDGSTASRIAGQGPIGQALLSQKPAGIIMTYSVLTGQDYQLVFTNHPNYQDVFGDYTTYQGMFVATPGI